MRLTVVVIVIITGALSSVGTNAPIIARQTLTGASILISAH